MSFYDGFIDSSKMDLIHSENYIMDARQLVCQSRTRGNNYFRSNMTDLSQWSVNKGGTASIQIVSGGQGGTNNPAGQNVIQFSTGATQNSLCMVSRKLSNLPASFGLFMLPALPGVDGNPQDALSISIQNTVDNVLLNLLIYANEVLVGKADGSYASLSTHSPAFLCEDWLEVKSNGGGNITVSLYQGTQFVSSLTLAAPAGPLANSGLVQISQQSAGAANQTSWMGGFELGDTQLPDDGLIQSISYAIPFNAQSVTVEFDVEDVCANVVLGADFTAQLIVAGSEIPLTLIDRGSWSTGIIDFTKPVRKFTGTYVPAATISQNTAIAYKAHMLNGKFMALLGATMKPTSIY